MQRIILMLLGLGLVVPRLRLIDAECCYGTFFYTRSYQCGGYCCGRGPCNIFCCNCDNGCKNKNYERATGSLQNVSLIADTHFRTIDIDGSNGITLEEAKMYLKNKTKLKRNVEISIQKDIRKMDTNNDGIISPQEFDESL